MSIVVLSEDDIDALMRVAEQEFDLRKANVPRQELERGVRAVVDTIINRAGSERAQFPQTITEVVNQGADKVNGAQFTPVAEAGGHWRNLPRANPETERLVKAHLRARALGASSSVYGHLNYFNPYESGYIDKTGKRLLSRWQRGIANNPHLQDRQR